MPQIVHMFLCLFKVGQSVRHGDTGELEGAIRQDVELSIESLTAKTFYFKTVGVWIFLEVEEVFDGKISLPK